MTRRAVWSSTALLLTVGLAGTASAAAPVSCGLVKDKAGDATFQQLGQTPSDDGLDGVGGDLASDKSVLTVVIKLKAWTSPDPQGPLGRDFYFEFRPAKAPTTMYLSYNEAPTGAATFSYGDLEPQASGFTNYVPKGQADGVIKGNELHTWADADTLGDLGSVAPKTKIAGLQVETFNRTGTLLNKYDTATGKTYVAGTKSCIPLGK